MAIDDVTDLATIQELSAIGRHQDCLQACQNALQVNPEEASAYKYAGKSLLALGQFEKAQQCLVKAHQLDGSDPEIVKDIGNIFNTLQNDAEAIRLYKAALSIDPYYAPAINNLGLIAKRQGDLVTAEQLVKKARDLDQSFAPYHMNLSGIYKDLGQLDQALASTLKSLELKPDNPDTHINLGGIYKDLGQLDQALASTLKSLELKPDNPDAHINLGGIYQDLGQLDQALASTLKSLELKPDNPTAHMNLGGIYKELTQLDQALASTLKSLELKPDNPTAHMNLGGIYKDLGQLDQALASTLKSLELKPDNPTAHMNLGGIYKELTQLDQALASTLKSLELKPDNPKAHINLGGIYRDLGQLDQALASTLKSLELKPDNPTTLMNLGGIYKELGQLDQALASTLKSLELKPDNPDAHMNLGDIYRDLGQLDQALAATLKSLELKPDNPDAHMNLGAIYRDLGQIDNFSKAVQSFISLTYKQQNLSEPIEHILADKEKLYSFFNATAKNGILGLQHYFVSITSCCLFENINIIDWYWVFLRASNHENFTTPILNLLPYVLLPDESKALCSLAKKVYNNSNKNIEPVEGSAPFIAPLDIKKESPARRLSFGFVSSDTINHSCSPFLYAITNELIKQGHAVNTYSSKLINCSTETEFPQSSSFISTKNVSLHGLSLEESRNMISSEVHDVLIEAEGLTNNGYNMKLLNRHLAPLQLSFLGYPGTTGNTNIDFFLTDKYYKIIDDDFFTEQALAIDGSTGARYPIIGAPDPGDCPFTKNGYITFGSLNNSYKITSLSIKIWAKIMHRCDLSRFIFFRNCYSSTVLQANINAEFEKHGISSSRISYIDNNKAFPSHFDCYNEFDISLDTFPLTGGVTTYDSLWMGVPVVTIEGDNIHQRIASSVLQHASLPELVSSSQEEMIEIAVRIASDQSTCLRWKKELRSHLQSTDLFNPSKTALSLAKEIGRITSHKRLT